MYDRDGPIFDALHLNLLHCFAIQAVRYFRHGVLVAQYCLMHLRDGNRAQRRAALNRGGRIVLDSLINGAFPLELPVGLAELADLGAALCLNPPPRDGEVGTG